MDFFVFVSEQFVLVLLLTVLIIAYFTLDSAAGGKTIDNNEAVRLVNQGKAAFIDLRKAKEFSAGHISGAVNLEYAKLLIDHTLVGSDKEQTIVLVDAMGQHTGGVGKKLKEQGYEVVRLRGGMAEWRGQNLPVVKS